MSIKQWIDELDKLKAEIARNNAINRKLRARSQLLEVNIAEYLKAKDHAGVKYRGRTIQLETKERRVVKQGRQKEADVIEFFANLGMDDPRDVYRQLQNVQRRDPVSHEKVSIKKIKGTRV